MLKSFAPPPSAPANGERAAEQEAAAPPSGPFTPRERLTVLSTDIESRLRGHFARAEATFDVYTPSQRRLPALQAVRLSVIARKAEALYHAGLRGEARRAWSAILAEDALDLEARRNIAVCDSRSFDLQRTLDSWRAYAEMLYFYALSARDPVYLAAEREEFHRTFADAYFPPGMNEKKEPSPRAADEAFAFLTSPPRVRSAMRHQILAFMNRRLTVKTAPFLVGVARGESEHARNAARERTEAWVARLCRSLPTRVGPRFSALVGTRLAESMEQLASPQKMRELSAAAYETDKSRSMTWIHDVVQFKNRLCGIVRFLPEPSSREQLATLAELCAADDIPIDTSEELLSPVAIALHASPPILHGLVTRALTGPLLHAAFPNHSEDEPRDVPLRVELYQRLVAARDALVDETLEVLDDPSSFRGFEVYPPQVRAAVGGDRNAAAAAVAHLRMLHERYPLSAGIAYDYAYVLLFSGRKADAVTLIENARQTALSERGRKKCEQFAAELAKAPAE